MFPEWFQLFPAAAATLMGAAVAFVERRSERGLEEAPFRAEIFSRERLADHAREIAAQHHVAPQPEGGQPLLPRLEESARLLLATYRDLAQAARHGETIMPAAEWLLDNFHVVEEQIADIRRHLPRRYYGELPKLTEGSALGARSLAGYPRVYAAALELIAHTDGGLDEQSLSDYVRAYQDVAPLSIGELWAVAIMLRVGLVENLRRLAAPLAVQRKDRKEADDWAERLLETAANQPGDVVVLLGELARRRGQMTRVFVARLLQRLRGRGPMVMPVLDWLERTLREQGTNAETLIAEENQAQAADQVSIRNTMTSFRLLANLDWAVFFESTSLVEQVLAQDPAGVYSQSDFQTRDACRHEVERIGRRCRISETAVAQRAVELARRGMVSAPDDPRRGHLGYYLIGDGCLELESALGYCLSPRERQRRFTLRHATPFYLGSVAAVTLALLACVLAYAAQHGAGTGMLLLTGLLALVPASDLAVALVNRTITLTVAPEVLPKCDFSRGIPQESRTLVVVPALLSTEEGIDELLNGLEVHYLANEDPNLHFALLTDWIDAAEQRLPGDDGLLYHAVEGILQLNERYAGPGVFNRFFLFHRERRWNESQSCWMGWERKRGKLVELNRLLRGATDTSYTICIGDVSALEGTCYVLCLDADTQLPPDAARKLVGTIAHPLNRAALHPRLRRVEEGYGILQPRVSIALPSAGRSRFSRIFSGNAGVDPYTTAVSDVYQDLFREGIFCGKGIYKIDSFEAALEGRVADNMLLSHDLFEGCFARAGLVTDIELFDDYPSRYNTYSARQHRWVRGDWQLVPWLLPRVPTATSSGGKNPLSKIARWKILDNLRRSLVAPALLLLLAAGWLVLPGSPGAWTLIALLVSAFPIYAHLASALFVDPRGVPWTPAHVVGARFWGIWDDLLTNTLQALVSLGFLAHQAYSMADAIGRTLWRVCVSRRQLLEWQTAADAERRLGTNLLSFGRRMWPSALLGAALTAVVAAARPAALPVALPFLLAWLASPLLAWWISQPLPDGLRRRLQALSGEERSELRQIARRTWSFFEEFVTEHDRWLPPDNFQEDPEPRTTHRTSPTNVGLYLLSILTARDFGYVGLIGFADRLERTLWTIAGMERYRGHFLNWYDTTTTAPMAPQYISTVDSGNLAGSLLAVKQACLHVLEESVLDPQALHGLDDTLRVLEKEAARSSGDGTESAPRPRSAAPGSPAETRSVLATLLRGSPLTACDWHGLLTDLGDGSLDLCSSRPPVAGHSQTADPAAWAARFRAAVAEFLRDVDTLMPWAEHLARRPGHAGPDAGALQGSDVRTCGSVDEGSVGFATSTRPHVHTSTCPHAPFATLEGPVPTLAALPDRMGQALGETDQLLADPALSDEVREWLTALRAALEVSRSEATVLIQRFHGLADLATRLFEDMDFSFLYDAGRDLFSVGYNLSESRLDRYHYDLLASECRLASFVAIAKKDVPQKHWFRMGRPLTRVGDARVLVSWSGTMFEYLMPLLLMRDYEGTLLAQTLPAVVAQQERFGAQRGVPWGVSESGFNARDPHLNYQYQAFGAPGLGLKPDLGDDVVVAPYATLLALPVAPRRAYENLQALISEGLAGRYGFYEAIDYTVSRVPRGKRSAIVRSFMAHHQGMALVSLDNYFFDNRMQKRFHADPLVRGAELLLQERNPREAPIAHPHLEQALQARNVEHAVGLSPRHYDTPHTSTPRTQLLSNGRYSLMVTNAGGGYSAWREFAITRWREDMTRDHWGMFFYLRDARSGEVWSAAHQPVRGRPRDYEACFAEDKAEFRRRVSDITSHLEIAVSAEDDVEVRRLTLTNVTDQARELEVTGYCELVLSSPNADLAHPAFSNLFVQTEFIPQIDALLATRRPRAADQKRVWAAHVLALELTPIGNVEYETDRARFLGRGRTPGFPVALTTKTPLSGSAGAVLDPIFSLRRRVRLAGRETVRLTFTTAAAESREDVLRLAERYRDPRAVARAFDVAWTHSQIALRNLNLTDDEANLCQRLASRVLFVDSFVRPAPDVLSRNTLGQSGLWPYGISGDLPIILAQVGDFEQLELVRQLLVAHEYLRLKGLAFDLVVLNEHPASYLQLFEEALLAAARDAGSFFDRPGGVFIRRAELIPDVGRTLLQFVSRAVFNGWAGSLSDQLDWRPERREPPVAFQPLRSPYPPNPLPPPRLNLEFANGLGGFSADGKEYVILLEGEEWTPAPWANVVANERFGFIATEGGLGFTWAENSRENRLTPWSNDPVSDQAGEILYLRHEETGRLWSATPLPVREPHPYVVRHGAGYTSYEHTGRGVQQELLVFVPPEDPVKICSLRLRNVSERPQLLSVTSYAEWVLGVAREQTHPHVITSVDADTGALLARNPYNSEFGDRIAFADVNRPRRTLTADRTEFLGRNGIAQRPRALRREHLSGTVGAELDPCAAIQVEFELQPGEETEIVFMLGQGRDLEEVRDLVRKYRDGPAAATALSAVRSVWDRILGVVQVRTPDRALDLLLNRWLLYQALSCRVWGRSAFYQSGGAYGFRDQLQDVMSLCISRPDVTRAQLLRAAARQFVEGDVQHWWHPPSGRGVRTRFSDDLLWLPYVTAHYLRVTGDWAVLDEQVPFLHGRLLAEQEDEYFDLPVVTEETATLYEHCLRAITRGCTRGDRGLPLMGTGDWNDGMNRVGHEGKGESVWVAWFLITTLREFAPICESRGDSERAEGLLAEADRYREAVEVHAWDGEWYRRAYFDDGTPLGSRENSECRIDSIAQSWAVISGAAEPERARQAMRSVEEHLVREQDGLILLFTPPFDKSPLDPGYIQGYLPGVRENGGQYTHAALWTVLATALLGEGTRAHQLFSLINPIRHAGSRAAVECYRVEPYVVAADVYGAPPHTGRGGWTWYTGSASWMYRVGLEAILGFHLRGDRFTLEPCIPAAWDGFELMYTRAGTSYRVTVENPHHVERGVASITLDGAQLADGMVPLVEDGQEHAVRVVLGT